MARSSTWTSLSLWRCKDIFIEKKTIWMKQKSLQVQYSGSNSRIRWWCVLWRWMSTSRIVCSGISMRFRYSSSSRSWTNGRISRGKRLNWAVSRWYTVFVQTVDPLTRIDRSSQWWNQALVVAVVNSATNVVLFYQIAKFSALNH